MQQLLDILKKLDKAPFGKLKGSLSSKKVFLMDCFRLEFDHIQGSPGADPASIARICIDREQAGLDDQLTNSLSRCLAVEDFLIRRYNNGILKYAKQNRGSDGSGSFYTVELEQTVLKRDAVVISDKTISIRFIFSFPSKIGRGGQLDFDQVRIMLEQELPLIAKYALLIKDYDNKTLNSLKNHIRVIENWSFLQERLDSLNLVAFVGDGSVLPRRSGDDDRPMEKNAVAFVTPESLKVSIKLPNGDYAVGMGIPEGITCITGGGFHGKSTLLDALCVGIYPHIPDDGRELVVTRKNTVYIQAEDGRSIKDVDISPFINNLPNGKNSKNFFTEDASGSTSQAASMVESIEAGAEVLLLDEDTCATNLLMRDKSIRSILPAGKEPIRPLSDSIRTMWQKYRISVLIVIGGLGAFLKQSDTVILIDEYTCHNITGKVREVLGSPEEIIQFSMHEHSRQLSNTNFDPSFYNKKLKKKVGVRIKPHHVPLKRFSETLEYGHDFIELGALRQIQGYPQLRFLGWMLFSIRQHMQNKPDTKKTITQWLDWVYDKIDSKGMSEFKVDYYGLQAMPPRMALGAAINRMRSLEVENV